MTLLSYSTTIDCPLQKSAEIYGANDIIQVYLASGASSAAIVSSNIYNVFSISKTGKGN